MASTHASNSPTSTGADNEWRQHWPLVLAALFGVSAPMIAIYALGQFIAPLTQEFGWTRTQITSGLSISLILGFVTGPLIGRVVDKIHVRWLVIPGLVLLGLAIAAFSFATPSIGFWITLWCIHALISALVSPTVWLAVVSAAFDRHRSLAIAVCLCGTALGSGLGPIVTRMMLNHFDWRTAFQVLGVLWVAPSLILALVFFFDRRDLSGGASSQGHPSAHASAAPTNLKSIFQSATFIKLGIAVAITGIAGSAYSIHLVPALSSKGIDLTNAATLAGIAGLASIPGKLAAGALFDRYGGTTAAMVIMAAFGVASALLALPSHSFIYTLLACFIFGFAVGANFALNAVLAAKLFDSSVFGVIYGTLMSITAVGAAIGPLAISFVYDSTHSYTSAFLVGIGIAMLAAFLLHGLKPVGEAEQLAEALA